MDLPTFNAAPAGDLTPQLLACCDVPAWVATVLEGRPYASVDDLLVTADAAARQLTVPEVDRALAAHPRIGDPPQAGSTEAGWSRQEQAGVSRDAEIQAALVAGNRAYEERFGRVFLICATGLSGERVLAQLRARLDNDPATEQAVVAEELRKIALLRLRKLISRGAEHA